MSAGVILWKRCNKFGKIHETTPMMDHFWMILQTVGYKGLKTVWKSCTHSQNQAYVFQNSIKYPKMLSQSFLSKLRINLAGIC